MELLIPESYRERHWKGFRAAMARGATVHDQPALNVPAPGEPQGMAPWEYTIAELLSDGGYATAMYGKWHIGDKDGRLPNDQGYDEWYGTKESAMEASYTSTRQFDPKVFPTPYIWAGRKGQKSKKVKPFDLDARAVLDREITDKTIAFMRAHAKDRTPFYVYAAFTQIHPPFLSHPDFKGESHAGPYADIQMEVDHNVGRVLDAIEQAGIDGETIVILTGDNAAGEDTGEGGSNGPWRGGLSTGYEGGTRTVGMIRWPGKVKAGRVSDEIVSDLDWFPTLAHLAGEEDRIPKDRPYDGFNQAAFLLGKQEKSSREHIVTYVGDRVFSVKDFEVTMTSLMATRWTNGEDRRSHESQSVERSGHDRPYRVPVRLRRGGVWAGTGDAVSHSARYRLRKGPGHHQASWGAAASLVTTSRAGRRVSAPPKRREHR